jgi:hypothetical protein
VGSWKAEVERTEAGKTGAGRLSFGRRRLARRGSGAEVWSRGFRGQGSEYAIWEDRGLERRSGRWSLEGWEYASWEERGLEGRRFAKRCLGGRGLEEGVWRPGFGTCNLGVGKSGGWRARLWRQGFGDQGWTGLAG